MRYQNFKPLKNGKRQELVIKKMNEIISDYLFKFAEHPDPRYAVMLKGKWGCGKSFFVEKWVKQFAEKYENGEQTLQPLYISLYGLKSVDQITKEIDKQLHPYFYSKGAEFTKKLFKIASKIAFKTTIDWNKDGNQDMSFDATLDSLSLLTSKDDVLEGTKVIVFDDLERCLIDMKLLLGYINTFVEHGACHVVIVGDETHVPESSRKTILEFKEKTIGREFEIQPDTVGAVRFFLNHDVPIAEWIKQRDQFIIDVFLATKFDNLRLLRQCLYDFNSLYHEIETELLEKDSMLMNNLLGSYIVTYSEYRGEYHDLLREWSSSYMWGLTGDEKKKGNISDLQSKYRQISEKYTCNLLNADHIKHIVYEIETGFSLKHYVENLLRQSQRILTKQDKLAGFLNLSGKEFNSTCDSLIQDICSGHIQGSYLLGRSLALMAFFDKENVYWMPQAAISLAKKQIADLFKSITDKDNLYVMRDAFFQGCSSFMQFYDTPIGKDVCDFANREFDMVESVLPNKMEIALNNLSDNNVSVLCDLSGVVTPDHQCDYSLTSIFKNIDPRQFSERVTKLTNVSLRELSEFFCIHYRFGCSLGSGCNRYNEDLSTLLDVKSILSTEFAIRNGIDRYAANRFLKYLDGAIKRTQGDNGVIMY